MAGTIGSIAPLASATPNGGWQTLASNSTKWKYNDREHQPVNSGVRYLLFRAYEQQGDTYNNRNDYRCGFDDLNLKGFLQ